MMAFASENPKLSPKHPKIFAAVIRMMPFIHEQQELPTRCSKFFAAPAVRSICFPCGYSSSGEDQASLSSEDESLLGYHDDKHVIILAVRGRADLRTKTSTFSEDGLCWFLSPTSEKPLIGAKIHKEEEEDQNAEQGKDKNDDDDDTETFFSVKSNFSQCSGDGASDAKVYLKHMMFEEIQHLEGWPFGLWKKPVRLPPLPRSPADSWIWNKRGRLLPEAYKNEGA